MHFQRKGVPLFIVTGKQKSKMMILKATVSPTEEREEDNGNIKENSQWK